MQTNVFSGFITWGFKLPVLFITWDSVTKEIALFERFMWGNNYGCGFTFSRFNKCDDFEWMMLLHTCADVAAYLMSIKCIPWFSLGSRKAEPHLTGCCWCRQVIVNYTQVMMSHIELYSHNFALHWSVFKLQSGNHVLYTQVAKNVWIIYTSYCEWRKNQTQMHKLNCASRHARKHIQHKKTQCKVHTFWTSCL